MEWLIRRYAVLLRQVAQMSWRRPVLAGLATFATLLALQWALLLTPWRIGVDMQASRCLPYTLYLMDESPVGEIHPGDIVRFDPGTRMFVPGMGQLNHGLEVIKVVAAVAGDRVQVTANDILVNGKVLAESPERLAGIALYQRGINPATLVQLTATLQDYERSFVVPPGELFMVGTMPRAYDSRYWGTIPLVAVKARAWPLW